MSTILYENKTQPSCGLGFMVKAKRGYAEPRFTGVLLHHND